MVQLEYCGDHRQKVTYSGGISAGFQLPRADPEIRMHLVPLMVMIFRPRSYRVTWIWLLRVYLGNGFIYLIISPQGMLRSLT